MPKEKDVKKALLALGALLLASLPVLAQNRSIFGGNVNAYDFAYGWNPGSPAIRVSAFSGVCAGGGASCTLTMDYGYTYTGSGLQFQPFNLLSSIVIGTGASLETVTPTAVACTTPYIQQTCNVTIAPTNAHGPGDTVRSGTIGLEEAITTLAQLNFLGGPAGTDTDQFTGLGGTVAVDAGWVQAGGTTAMLTGATGLNLVNLYVNSGTFGPGQGYYMAWRPNTSSTTSTPTAPTVAVAAGGALSTGSGGTYYLTYEYVDMNGQLSQYATDSSQQTVTAGNQTITMTAPAASSGMVGYIPMITAAGGSTGGEIAVPVTSSVCTVTKLETLIPACALTNSTYGQLSSAASIAANPSSTMKVVTSTASLARTGFAYIPVGESFPLPFSPVFTGQNTGAATAATYQVAALNLPTGIFNYVAKKYRICMEGHMTAGGSGTSTLAVSINYGPYNNSDTSLISFTTGAFTATSGTVTFEGCSGILTTTTGSAGAMYAHGQLGATLAATSVTTWYQDNGAGVNSLPLSTQQQIRIQAIIGTASFGGNVNFDSITLEPIN